MQALWAGERGWGGTRHGALSCPRTRQIPDAVTSPRGTTETPASWADNPTPRHGGCLTNTPILRHLTSIAYALTCAQHGS